HAARDLEQLPERNAEGQLVVAGLLDVPRDREDRRAARALHAEIGEPLRALADDRRNRREALRVVDRRRPAVEAVLGRERRLEARPALLALERLEERRLLAADVRARADERVEVEVDPRPLDVLAEPAGLVRLLQGLLEARERLGHELAADVVVADRRADRVAGDRHALDQRVRVVAEDVPIVARARLALVGVADEVFLPGRIRRHERELEPRREARAAAAAQPRRLDLLDDLRAVELAVQHALPGLVAADLVVVLERPGFLVELERRKADEVLFPHGLLPASGGSGVRPLSRAKTLPQSRCPTPFFRLTPANRGSHRPSPA